MEDIIKNKGNPNKVLESSLHELRTGFIGNILNRLEFRWY